MEVAFPSRFCAHCYCHSCRTTHAAGVVTWIGFKRSQVRITKGAGNTANVTVSAFNNKNHTSPIPVPGTGPFAITFTGFPKSN